MSDALICDDTHVILLGDLAARAFLDDPLYAFIFPDHLRRRSLVAWDMANIVRYGLRFGEVVAAAALQACAVWLPPGMTDFTEPRMAEAGMLEPPAGMPSESEARMATFIAESEAFHRQVAPQPHWYLVLLCVDPSRQSQGIGSGLLAAGLERADAAGLPVYLETASPKNLPFYRRRGFETCAQAALPGGGCDLWYLVRQPAERAQAGGG